MFKIRNLFIFCYIASSVSLSAPLSDNPLRSIFLPEKSKFSASHYNQVVLSKRSASLQWKQTGTSEYYYNNNDSTWNFSSRDTVIYDNSGNEIIRKTSRAHTGWSIDSLSSIDSTVYLNGKMIETTNIELEDGKVRYGLRSTLSYFNDGKQVMITGYYWDSIKSIWFANRKDTTVFSEPVNITLQDDDVFYKLLIMSAYVFDTSTSTWKFDGSYRRINEESNATTLVTESKYYEDDSIYCEKYLIEFSSVNWSDNNIIEQKTSVLNPDGKYFEEQKTIYSSDHSMYTSSSYIWDNVSKTPINNNNYVYQFDSHNNDTLTKHFFYDTNTNTWDTTMTHTTITYDANGNNTLTIESWYSDYNHLWTFGNKQVNTFAQVQSPVINFRQQRSDKTFSILKTPGSIRFSAPDLAGLSIYTMDGRIVTSIKQNSNSAITFNLSDPNTKFTSGLYIVKLKCKNEVRSVPFMIK